GKYTHNYKEVAIGLPIQESPIVFQKSEQLDGQVSLSVPLFAPAAYPALGAARESFAAARATYAITETGILFQIAQPVFAAAGTDALLEARTHGGAVARTTLDNARARLEAGTVNRTEVTRAELALLHAEQQQLEATDGRFKAYRSLRTLLDLGEAV